MVTLAQMALVIPALQYRYTGTIQERFSGTLAQVWIQNKLTEQAILSNIPVNSEGGERRGAPRDKDACVRNVFGMTDNEVLRAHPYPLDQGYPSTVQILGGNGS